MADLDAHGFQYRGQCYEAQKAVGARTHRSKSAAETLNAIRPIFAHAGITRLADITDLDRIGVPVTLAIRPNSRTLAVSSGKSTDLCSALTSGAMESLELYHAEYAEPPRIVCTYDDLIADHQAIDFKRLPL
ncbi:hypothetical protein N4G42_08820, partial [Acidovorax sp. K2F]|nr:hypothetical protein [Acidovorax sp. K2F]